MTDRMCKSTAPSLFAFTPSDLSIPPGLFVYFEAFGEVNVPDIHIMSVKNMADTWPCAKYPGQALNFLYKESSLVIRFVNQIHRKQVGTRPD